MDLLRELMSNYNDVLFFVAVDICTSQVVGSEGRELYVYSDVYGGDLNDLRIVIPTVMVMYTVHGGVQGLERVRLPLRVVEKFPLCSAQNAALVSESVSE